jgi:L-threonylcarbamoyladenylate synthase
MDMETIIGTDVGLAATLLKDGRLVGIPTETVYGLAANALMPPAVLDIFRVKGRPAFDPLIVHVGEKESLGRYAVRIPDEAMALADRFWPGPLTLVLPKAACIPDEVSSGLDTVGLRMPDHPLTLALLRQTGFPLAAPSANPFGYISPTSAMHVYDQLQGKIPYILDGGPCRVGVESTIVGFEEDVPVIYRLGGLTVEDIRSVAPSAKVVLHASSDPRAPGMLKSHYAPRIPLFLGDLESLLDQHKGKRIGVLAFNTPPVPCASIRSVQLLSSSSDMNEAASRLFGAMRLLDHSEVDVVLAEPVPDQGLGKAINDRLRRAAHRE